VRAGLLLKFAICAVLIAMTWAVFGRTFGYGFVNYDDRVYVAGNPQIQAGLSWQNIRWAFTHVHSNNWHPLTTMSHMLDCQLFGVRPGWHHLENVVLHSIAAILLFLLLQQMSASGSGGIWASASVATLFAIHPLRVESVAWISERKDVLTGVFFMLTLLAYLRYTRKQTAGRYVLVVIAFVCGLLSKPMVVTLPIILLLLDYWPLRRMQRTEDRGGRTAKLLLEKIPLFALSAASATATIVAQSTWGLVPFKTLPLAWRITNALAAYVIYIWEMIWPADLALGYSHQGRLPTWQTLAAAAFLILITVCVFILRKRTGYLMVGWFWYLIMLLPVIGLIQVGGQSHADRYTYLPQIGLYIALAWGVLDLSRSSPYRGAVLGTAAAVMLGALGLRAANQVIYWHDSERLWRHALAATSPNPVAHLGLAGYFADQGRFEDATAEYKAAAKIGTPDPEVETTLANLLLEHGSIAEAVRYYEHVVRLQPSRALAHYNLAVGLHRLGRLPEAIAHYKEALAIDPKYPDAQYFLEQAQSENGQEDNQR
jgi:tetratricopeptide (TPR) repeat protein